MNISAVGVPFGSNPNQPLTDVWCEEAIKQMKDLPRSEDVVKGFRHINVGECSTGESIIRDASINMSTKDRMLAVQIINHVESIFPDNHALLIELGLVSRLIAKPKNKVNW